MIKILNHEIGLGSPPFIIAEMSGNHNQSLQRALSIVEAIADSGADAIKLQTYTPDTMTLDLNKGDFFINDDKSLWGGKSLYNLYAEAHTPWEWHKPIFDKARDLGLIAFSTPFDNSSVDFLESLDVPCYKIASFEITDIELIRYVAARKKPLIISTGMASISEIHDAVTAAKESGNSELILLKCTSTYPADPENSNILTIPHMKKLFSCDIGLSDHTMGIGVSVASIALGCAVIEKHFTLDRHDGGVDSSFSMEPSEMKQLVIEAKRAWQALGCVNYSISEKEKKSLMFRRSLYITKNLKLGDILSRDNVRSIRPGLGLPPKFLKAILGRKINKDIKRGTALNWDLIS